MNARPWVLLTGCAALIAIVAGSALAANGGAATTSGSIPAGGGTVAAASTPANTTWYRDADGDGYGWYDDTVTATAQPTGYVANHDDCHDGDPSIHPGATDVPNDGVDQDCDGADATGTANVTWYPDVDSDGYGQVGAAGTTATTQPPGYVTNALDCDDQDPVVHPGATDVPNNGLDEDCDGIDASATTTATTTASTTTGTTTVTTGAPTSAGTGTATTGPGFGFTGMGGGAELFS